MEIFRIVSCANRWTYSLSTFGPTSKFDRLILSEEAAPSHTWWSLVSIQAATIAQHWHHSHSLATDLIWGRVFTNFHSWFYSIYFHFYHFFHFYSRTLTYSKQRDLQQVLGGDDTLPGPVHHHHPEADRPADHGEAHEGLEKDDVLQDVALGLNTSRQLRQLGQCHGSLEQTSETRDGLCSIW